MQPIKSRNQLLEALTGTVFSSDSLSEDRLSVVALTQAELATAEGRRFYTEYDATLAGGDIAYILYQMPSVASGFIVALQERRFKSLNGSATIDILWDSTDVTPGTPIDAFNENRNSANTSNMITSVIATPTGGVIRESDFLSESGVGINSSGDISSESGSRIYSPDSFFIAKIVNTHSTTNRVHLSYTHAEIALSSFS